MTRRNRAAAFLLAGWLALATLPVFAQPVSQPPGGGGSGTSPCSVFGTTTGTCAQGDDSRITGAAPAANPTLTGVVTVPTPSTADNSAKAASTAYVQANLASYSPLASPALTGTPTAPTPSTSDSSTKIATTAFVQANVLQSLASISSNWYAPPFASVSTGTATTANRIVCWLDYELKARTIKALGTRTTTTLNASNVSLAKYAADGTGGTPGTLLAHTGSIVMGASAGVLSGATVETTPTIPAGPVWDCSNSDNATVVFQAPNASMAALGASVLIGDASETNVDNGAALISKNVFTAQTFGTWAAGGTYTWTGNATTLNSAMVLEQAN